MGTFKNEGIHFFYKIEVFIALLFFQFSFYFF